MPLSSIKKLPLRASLINLFPVADFSNNYHLAFNGKNNPVIAYPEFSESFEAAGQHFILLRIFR